VLCGSLESIIEYKTPNLMSSRFPFDLIILNGKSIIRVNTRNIDFYLVCIQF